MTDLPLRKNDQALLFGLSCIVPSVLIGVAFPAISAVITFSGLILMLGYRDIGASLKEYIVSPIAWCWAGFLAFVLLASVDSLDRGSSLEATLYLSLNLFFAGWVVRYLADSTVKTQRLLHFVLCGILIMLVLALVHVYLFPGLLRHMPFSTRGLHEYLIMFKKPSSGFLLLLPFCGYLLWCVHGRARLLPMLAIMGIVWLIVVVESRSAMAGIIAILGTVSLLGAIVARLRARSILLILAGLVMTVAMVGGYLITIRGHWQVGALGVQGWIIDPPRQILWNEILLVLQENFPKSLLLGVGPNALHTLDRGMVEVVLAEGQSYPFARIGRHPHNWPLEILVEVGFVGLCLLLTAVLATLCWGWQQRVHAPAEVITLFAVFAAYFGAGLTNYSVWEVWWQIAFATCSAIACGMVAAKSRKAQLEL